MKKSFQIIASFIVFITLIACIETSKKATLVESNNNSAAANDNQELLSLTNVSMKKVVKTDAEWKKSLTSNQFSILRNQATERPFDNAFQDNKENGNYFCAGCKLPLFNSKTKFDSGTGWPSFYAPIEKNRVAEVVDKTLGMVRGEIVCARCDGHLGHVFDDGPNPTGLRYCMNSGAMLFQESK